MTAGDARTILGLSHSYSPEELKRAFKRRAFETHPDRGGSATRFLEVQAAFELLARFEGQHFQEVFESNSELNQHIEDIKRAFEAIAQEANSLTDQVFAQMIDNLVERLNSYQSHGELKKKIERDLSLEWHKFVTELCAFLDEQISAIADSQQEWIQAYMAPALKQAMLLNPARWFEKSSTCYFSYLAGLAVAIIALTTRDYYLLLAFPLICGPQIVMRRLYLRRYAVRRVIRGIQTADVAAQLKSGNLNLNSDRPSSDTTLGIGSLIGATIGGVLLGPIGAAIGAALLGWIGSLFGITLDKRKGEILDQIHVRVEKLIPQLHEELSHRIIETQTAMIAAIRDNFRKNSKTAIALLGGKSVPSPFVYGDVYLKLAGWRAAGLFLVIACLGFLLYLKVSKRPATAAQPAPAMQADYRPAGASSVLTSTGSHDAILPAQVQAKETTEAKPEVQPENESETQVQEQPTTVIETRAEVQATDQSQTPSGLDNIALLVQDEMNQQGIVRYTYVTSNLPKVTMSVSYEIAEANIDKERCALRTKETNALVIVPDRGVIYSEAGKPVSGDDLDRQDVETSTTRLDHISSITTGSLQDTANGQNGRNGRGDMITVVAPQVFYVTLLSSEKNIVFHQEITRGIGKPKIIRETTSSSNTYIFQKRDTANVVSEQLQRIGDLCRDGN